jgi:LysM repeat protein
MYTKYVLKRGESLKDVATIYNTDVDTLKSINNLYYDSNLREGLEIIVPQEKEDAYKYYTVEQGDTLYAIGKKYNMNPNLLASINGLDENDYIYPNQEILIPKANYSYYITKEGDTLDTVANIFQVSQTELIKNNPTVYLLDGQIIAYKRN